MAYEANTDYEDLMRSSVLRGTAVLDRLRPRWDEEIDLENLRLENYQACILGQLYGDYIVGLKAVGLSFETAAHNGFNIQRSLNDDGETIDKKFQVLTDTWKTEITARLHT